MQMVLLFTIVGFFLKYFLSLKGWLSLFCGKKEEIHLICSGAPYLWAHKLCIPQSNRK